MPQVPSCEDMATTDTTTLFAYHADASENVYRYQQKLSAVSSDGLATLQLPMESCWTFQ